MTEERELHKRENASAGSTEKEEIIDLTDEIKTPPQNDEEIIELMDEVVKTDSSSPADDVDSASKNEPDIPAVPEMSTETEETMPRTRQPFRTGKLRSVMISTMKSNLMKMNRMTL